MSDRGAPIEAAIAALEAQRAVLGSAVVDAALGPLRRELAQLRQQDAPAAARQQLKQVSVLFVDVVGSTAIGQQLAPEAIHAVMDSALERFTAAVQSHHGRVLQYTGDGMLAAFGTESASEDDAEDAVRAGLAVIDAAREHAPRVRQEHGVGDFNVRAGIHTGRVLLGGGVDADGSIRGATVNIAARMEQSAPVGRLRISQETWSLVRGLFDGVEQEPISVKGVEQPVRSYLIERARARAFQVPTRGIEGIATRMVGRDAELGELLQAFDDVAASGRPQALTVVGEAGLGKSRLLGEFQQQLDPTHRRCWLLLSRAHPRSALYPYGQLREALARQLQIADSDSPALAREKWLQGIGPLLGPSEEAALHVLGHLIGLDFAASPHLQSLLTDEVLLRERAFSAASLCLQRMASLREAPMVLVFDDLHWADDGSIEFLRLLPTYAGEMPLLCLTLTRPTLYERMPDWGEGEAWSRRLDIAPLGAAGSGELAAVLLQRIDSVPPALHAIVVGGAEGNPFYMEELVKMLIDDGVIIATDDGWRVQPDRLARARVPPTLAGVLQARLDALDVRERSALQQAAVVGHVFRDEALAAVDPQAVEMLPALLRKRLVVRQGGPHETGDYAFQHHLLHQVTYDSVLQAPRRRGHERAGEFWSARAEVARPQDVNAAACRALAEACEHWRLADPAALATWFRAQFSKFFLASSSGQTLRPLVHMVAEACELHYGPNHVETARALTDLGSVAVQWREIDQAEQALRRALAIQEKELDADHPDTARTLAVMGGSLQGRGDYAAAEPYFRRALHTRERLFGAEHALTLSTLDVLAFLTSELGRLDEAEALSRRVLQAHEHTLGAEAAETASARVALADILHKRGQPAAAEPLLRRALDVQRRLLAADDPDIGLSLWQLAEALRALGRVDEAEPLAREALRLWEASWGPVHEWTAWGLGSLAEIRLARQDAAEAVALATRALAIHERNFGPRHAQVVATLGLLARAHAALGDSVQAQALLQRVATLALPAAG
jgi:class 3 adenylate cyclase/tetratricopeptide (TPR) repeat protein